MTTQQQTEVRLACTEFILRVNEMGGGQVDITDTEDLIEKANNLYTWISTGKNVYVNAKSKEGE